MQVTPNEIKYADGDEKPLEHSYIAYFQRQTNLDSEEILATHGGWFECVADPGQGKTIFAYQLLRRGYEQGRTIFYCDTRIAQLSEEKIWPPDADQEKSHALVILDNAHLLEPKGLSFLVNVIPSTVTVVAFSRISKVRAIPYWEMSPY